MPEPVEPATLGSDDEPQTSGAVVAVHCGDYRRQELWVCSGINVGNWYRLGGETGPGVGSVPQHPTWPDVLARGPVTLLVSGAAEAYAAGWANGRRRLLEQIEAMADDD